MGRSLIVFMFLFFTLGCNNPSNSELEPIKLQLKDPASAQFRNVRYSNDKHHICGEVNSKNTYGGYVGFKKFLIKSKEKALIEGNDNFDNFYTDWLAADIEVLKADNERMKKGGKGILSKTEEKTLANELAFSNIYKQICGEK